MQYFDTLPKLIKKDSFGNKLLMTNIMARSSVLPALLNNASLFYQYDIQDGDTPESIAYKYYGEVYRYWIVLFVNQIIDPQWQWPMSTSVFNNYIADKYQSVDPTTIIVDYQKIVTTTDNGTNTTTVETVSIDENTYNSLATSTLTYSLPTGSVTVAISKKSVSQYDIEVSLNESNRTINILNNNYVDEIEKEFQSLMAV